MKIKITTKSIETTAELNNSETAKAICNALPIKSKANLWGEEIYFDIPIKLALEKEYAKQEMEIGDLAYWPEGPAFCIFFGKTPASISEKPRAISPVTFLGKVKNPEIFKKLKNNEEIILEK